MLLCSGCGPLGHGRLPSSGRVRIGLGRLVRWGGGGVVGDGSSALTGPGFRARMGWAAGSVLGGWGGCRSLWGQMWHGSSVSFLLYVKMNEKKNKSQMATKAAAAEISRRWILAVSPPLRFMHVRSARSCALLFVCSARSSRRPDTGISSIPERLLRDRPSGAGGSLFGE